MRVGNLYDRNEKRSEGFYDRPRLREVTLICFFFENKSFENRKMLREKKQTGNSNKVNRDMLLYQPERALRRAKANRNVYNDKPYQHFPE